MPPCANFTLGNHANCSHRPHTSFVDETDKDESITKMKSFTLKSGEELEVTVGLERYHAPEIFFKVSSTRRVIGFDVLSTDMCVRVSFWRRCKSLCDSDWEHV